MDKEYPINISIIIVNYNVSAMVHNCVSSIIKNTQDVTYEIIIVDNCSNKNELEELKKITDKNIKIILSDKNLGFGGANNLAFSKAQGKYLFLLNPDTIIYNNAIKIFVDFLDNHTETGAVGCILQDANNNPGNSYGDFISPKKILLHCLKLDNPKITTYINSIQEVDFVSGAAVVIPHHLIEKYGMFDTSFFMYCEEVDLEYRFAENGYHRYIIPGPKIMHMDGGTLNFKNKRSPFRRYHHDRSRCIYIKKHFNKITYYSFRLFFAICKIPALFNCNYSYMDNIEYMKMILSKIK